MLPERLPLPWGGHAAQRPAGAQSVAVSSFSACPRRCRAAGVGLGEGDAGAAGAGGVDQADHAAGVG